jgi:diguanylate cyclase (GGDEF)-like protein
MTWTSGQPDSAEDDNLPVLHAAGRSLAGAPLLDLRVAAAALVEAAAHLRSRWVTIPANEVDGLLLELEHDVVGVLSKVVRFGDGILALDGDRGGSGGGGGGSGGGSGLSTASAENRATGVRGGRLERDLVRLEREAAARDRATAALSLHLSAQLRAAATADRDRAALLLHRAALERAASRTDDVTGALERGHGMITLEQEIERCRRGNGRLVVGFVDVDGLKEVNDTRGHLAGDQLLRSVVVALKGSLRSYDVVVRFGGDEFVYSLSGVTLVAAKRRFQKMADTLAETTGGRTVSVGFAELAAADTLATVIARADADLYAGRRPSG